MNLFRKGFKLRRFTIEELNVIRIKNKKVAGLDEIPPQVWKSRKFDDILLRYCNDVYNQNAIDRWTKACIPFPQKGDPSLVKDYWLMNLNFITAKIYNALLLNRIEPEIEKVQRKNQNDALQSYESEGSLTGQWHRLLWHCHRSSERGYTSPIAFHNLPRRRTSNGDRSTERKWLHTRKGKKQTTPCTNYHGCSLCWWHNASGKYIRSGRIPAA